MVDTPLAPMLRNIHGNVDAVSPRALSLTGNYPLTMPATTRDLVLIIDSYFPVGTSLSRALYVITAITALWPLWRLHRRQSQEPRQPRETAWIKSFRKVLKTAAEGSQGDEDGMDAEDAEEIAGDIQGDIEVLYEFLGIDPSAAPVPPNAPPMILCTPRVECHLCPTHPSLRRRDDPQEVRVLTSDLHWRSALVFVAHCPRCRANYYPDCFTFQAGGDAGDDRQQYLEYEASYLRVSKHGVWVDRRVARAQERALVRFHAGWSNFANWINDLLGAKPHITTRQSQRLFLEHFARRLLIAHQKSEDFVIPAHPSSAVLAQHVREAIGVDGGVLPDALSHGCTECTHLKRYYADMVAEGLDGEEHQPDETVGVDVEVRDIGLSNGINT